MRVLAHSNLRLLHGGVGGLSMGVSWFSWFSMAGGIFSSLFSYFSHKHMTSRNATPAMLTVNIPSQAFERLELRLPHETLWHDAKHLAALLHGQEAAEADALR